MHITRKREMGTAFSTPSEQGSINVKTLSKPTKHLTYHNKTVIPAKVEVGSHLCMRSQMVTLRVTNKSRNMVMVRNPSNCLRNRFYVIVFQHWSRKSDLMLPLYCLHGVTWKHKRRPLCHGTCLRRIDAPHISETISSRQTRYKPPAQVWSGLNQQNLAEGGFPPGKLKERAKGLSTPNLCICVGSKTWVGTSLSPSMSNTT